MVIVSIEMAPHGCCMYICNHIEIKYRGLSKQTLLILQIIMFIEMAPHGCRIYLCYHIEINVWANIDNSANHGNAAQLQGHKFNFNSIQRSCMYSIVQLDRVNSVLCFSYWNLWAFDLLWYFLLKKWSPCGHRVVTKWSSMLNIYIYWHKCSCHACRRTDGRTNLWKYSSILLRQNLQYGTIINCYCYDHNNHNLTLTHH